MTDLRFFTIAIRLAAAVRELERIGPNEVQIFVGMP